jgi:lichenan operon transcriptional antiterminator
MGSVGIAYMLNNLGNRILECIIINRNVVSGQKLCEYCAASVNTIRKEIPMINEMLADHGCVIKPRTSIGYELVIENEKKAQPFLASRMKQIQRFSYLDVSENSRAYYIMRLIMTSQRPYTINELAERMFCSNSTIQRCLPYISHFLAQFSLTLVNRRQHGLTVQGSEWNYRNCLLYLEKAFQVLPKEEQKKEKEFQKSISNYRNPDVKQNIENQLKACLLKSQKIHIPFLYLPKISYYIIFSYNRRSQSGNLNFTEEQKAKARDDIVYPFVKNFYRKLPEYIRNGSCEDDYLAVSMLMQTYRSIADPSELPVDVYQNLAKEAAESIRFIQKKYDIQALRDPNLKNDLAYYLYTLNCSLLYGVPLDPEILVPTAEKAIFSAELCAEFARFYQQKHNVTLSEVQAMGCYYIFNRVVVTSQSFPYPQRAVVASIYGLAYSADSAALLQMRDPRLFSSLTTSTVTDADSYDPEKCDVLITDAPVVSRKKGITVFPLEFIHSDENIHSVRHWMNTIYQQHARELFGPDHMIRINVSSPEEVYEQILKQLGSLIKDKNDFLLDLKMKNKLLSSERGNKTAFISPLSYTFDSPQLYIFLNHKTILWSRQYCRYFVFYQYGKGSQKDIDTMNYLLRKIVHSSYEDYHAAIEAGYEEFINLERR